MPGPRDRSLDDIWLAAAGKVGVPVTRGGEAYVHFDGRVLRLAGDEHLDEDDTVAQLVLHELCHALVQGPERLRAPDWGMDNTTNDDEEREHAAVRLQAHLAGQHGLRHRLFPTTVVRGFFETLGDDAFAVDASHSAASATLAREAALRSVQEPWDDALSAALAQSAAVAAVPRHARTGLPARDPLIVAREARSEGALAPPATCGRCAFRSPGGLCRKAPGRDGRARVPVRVDDPACARFEATADCLACGACCRSAYHTVPITRADRAIRRHAALVVLNDSWSELSRAQVSSANDREGERRCAALDGELGGPYACRAYDDRPKACRDFEAGGRHCVDARRRVGLGA